ncbi:hypothetical protein [Stenotrophomonas acidaminiphila]
MVTHAPAGRLPVLLLPALLLAGSTAARAQQAADPYAPMLAYLQHSSRIDGNALAGSQGAIGINQAAGDLNLQANLRSVAVGRRADAGVHARQSQTDGHADAPLAASASIGGNALAGAGGIVSINQASGGGNTELNSVVVSLAAQGIREAGDEAMAAPSAFASAGERFVAGDPRAIRKVAVEASALRGFGGVLQLNQTAGSGNAVENSIGISVQGIP